MEERREVDFILALPLYGGAGQSLTGQSSQRNKCIGNRAAGRSTTPPDDFAGGNRVDGMTATTTTIATMAAAAAVVVVVVAAAAEITKTTVCVCLVQRLV